jgi:hypothetical protein
MLERIAPARSTCLITDYKPCATKSQIFFDNKTIQKKRTEENVRWKLVLKSCSSSICHSYIYDNRIISFREFLLDLWICFSLFWWNAGLWTSLTDSTFWFRGFRGVESNTKTLSQHYNWLNYFSSATKARKRLLGQFQSEQECSYEKS